VAARDRRRLNHPIVVGALKQWLGSYPVPGSAPDMAQAIKPEENDP
jgi:hypothetical protein